MKQIRNVISVWVIILLSIPASGSDQLRQRLEAWSADYPPRLFGEPLINHSHLLPSDYHFALLKPLLQGKPTPDYALYDLALSDAFMTLANHLQAGKIDPETNPYDVYLHDTPSRELFKKSQRAFSSGCIRVADPLELAEELLRSQQWTRERIDAVIAKAVTETVFLKNPMPVHIEYWTAWVDRGGILYFRKDIYQRDKPLLDALNTPLTSPEQNQSETVETVY